MVDAAAAPIDRYVVLEYLSEGGMGAIYVGKKLGAGGFEKEVVLKQLLPEFTKQEEFIELFLREAKLSATLDHANIVHTIDLVNAGNEYFIVMEYLPGGDLRTLLRKAKRRGNRFSPGSAIYIAREVLSALSYAHVKRDHDGTPLQLIHRDVSPSNVLLSQNGEVKLTDFGIAKAATHTSQFYKVKGKIGYMSPEQARSQDMDHRSDLYSLAVCFYEVLTGERLFIHAGLTTSADEIYAQPVPAVSRKVPGLPAEIDKIVWKSLAIDPNDRYQTAGEFQEALMRCAHRNGLLISAPELAAQLRQACGPVESWRDEDEEEVEDSKRPATEIYDAAEEEEDDDFSSMQPNRRDKSVKLTVPELLQGIELTSIINNIVELMDESKSGREELRSSGGLPSQKVPSPAGSPRPGGRGPRPQEAPGPRAQSLSSTSPQRPGAALAARATPPSSAPPITTLPGMSPPAPPGSNAGMSASGYPVVARAGSGEPAGILGPSNRAGAASGGGAPEPAAPPPQLPGFARMPTPPPVAMATPAMMPAESGLAAPMGPGPTNQGYPQQQAAPSYPVAPYPAPSYPAASPQHMPRVDASGSMPAHSEDPRRLKPWMFIAAVVLIGIVAAVIVGLSGPDIPDDLLPPPAPAPAAPAMPAAPPAAAPAAK
jgi:eukaryotic-like serine/threonine-protein kinase